jgi:hypothetical protein
VREGGIVRDVCGERRDLRFSNRDDDERLGYSEARRAMLKGSAEVLL